MGLNLFTVCLSGFRSHDTNLVQNNPAFVYFSVRQEVINKLINTNAKEIKSGRKLLPAPPLITVQSLVCIVCKLHYVISVRALHS